MESNIQSGGKRFKILPESVVYFLTAGNSPDLFYWVQGVRIGWQGDDSNLFWMSAYSDSLSIGLFAFLCHRALSITKMIFSPRLSLTAAKNSRMLAIMVSN